MLQSLFSQMQRNGEGLLSDPSLIHDRMSRTCNMKLQTTILHKPCWQEKMTNILKLFLIPWQSYWLIFCVTKDMSLNTCSHRKPHFCVVWLKCYVSLSPSLSDKVIRHRACSLKDTAHAIFASELDPEFDRMCEEIKEARKKRGKKIP